MTRPKRLGMLCGLFAVGVFWTASAQGQGQTPTTPTPPPAPSQFVQQVVEDGTRAAREAGPPSPQAGAPEQMEKTPEERPGRRVHVVGAVGGAPVQVTGQGANEPIFSRPVRYGEVPDEGDPVSIAGRMLPGEVEPQPVPLMDFLDQIAVATNWNIVVTEKAGQKRVRCFLNQVAPKVALNVLPAHGIHYDFDPATRFLYVSTVDEYLEQTYGALQQEFFEVEYAEVVDMQAILASLLSSKGRMVSNPRTGGILVTDTQDNLDQMREAVARLDRPLDPVVHQLNYMDAETLLDAVLGMLSERGVAYVDARVNALVVTDIPSRQRHISEVLAVLDRKLETRTWTLSYTEPEDIAERLGNIVPEEMGAISTDPFTHQISVTAIPERIEEIDALIRAWDVKGKQVNIEAFLVSASTQVTRNLGVNWAYFDTESGSPFAIWSGPERPDYSVRPDEGQRISIGRMPFQVPLYNTVPFTNIPVDPVTDIDGNMVADPVFRGNRLYAVLNFLNRQGDISILENPRITVLDGEEANFKAVEELPFQEGGYSTAATGDINRIIPLRVSFVDVGTILRVRPRITEDDNVLMDISAEDSTAQIVEVVSGDLRSSIPQKRSNTTETRVMVHDGQTIVIGGLRSTSVEDDVERVPILGDVPFVGRLFKTTRKDNRQRELLVFITPTIVDEHTRPEALRLADYDADMAARIRHSRKSLWERIEDRMTQGQNELGVSIGAPGTIHSGGKLVSVDELEQMFADAAAQAPVPTVVIRAHPNAPEAIAETVVLLAGQKGLQAEFDDLIMPFVPVNPADVRE